MFTPLAPWTSVITPCAAAKLTRAVKAKLYFILKVGIKDWMKVF